MTIIESCFIPSSGTTAFDGGEDNSWDDPYGEIGNWWIDWLGTDLYYISGPAESIDHYPNLFACDCGGINYPDLISNRSGNNNWFDEGVEPLVLAISIGSSIIIILVIIMIFKSGKSP